MGVKTKAGAAGLVAFAILLASVPAAAQEAKGFNLNRFDPSERGSDWFVLDSLDLRGHKRHAIGVVADYAYKPLVIYEPDGAERAAVIKWQAFTHLGASLVLWDRVRAGFSLPILLSQFSENSHIGATTFKPATNSTIGDIRVASDVRLFGENGDPMTAALGLAVYVPTGDRSSYTGDGKARLTPRLQVAGDVSPFAYAARLGFNYRAQTERFADTPMGSEVAFAVSAGVRALDNRLLFGPELYGTTGTSSGAFFSKATSPFEVLFGAHYRIASDFHLGLGVGPGVTRGLGTPLWRGAAMLEWHPAYEPPAPPSPPDRDHDAIADGLDACPESPGIWTDEPRTNGCPPPPPDRDRDGVVDPEDACMDVPGPATQDPRTNGCPVTPPDHDGDGVLDPEDACPEQAGVATQEPQTNGCPPPPPDRDGDSIIDAEDACPDHPGARSDDPKKSGCPVARMEGDQIRITEQVKFATGSAKLLPESDGVLDAVLEVLKKHPAISKVRIEGHTDAKGAEYANRLLSKDRAAAVAAWLVKRGIDKKRLESAGFGSSKPIDSNDTEAGRQNNRRVEFHVVLAQPAPESSLENGNQKAAEDGKALGAEKIGTGGPSTSAPPGLPPGAVDGNADVAAPGMPPVITRVPNVRPQGPAPKK
jgi:outer membrane protein OmpA-like peptidoglycan-associated protein